MAKAKLTKDRTESDFGDDAATRRAAETIGIGHIAEVIGRVRRNIRSFDI